MQPLRDACRGDRKTQDRDEFDHDAPAPRPATSERAGPHPRSTDHRPFWLKRKEKTRRVAPPWVIAGAYIEL
jgi:hypothetical protein